MNQSASDDLKSSEINEIIDVISREFERRFEADPEFRIEILLEDAGQHFDRISPESTRADAKHRAIAELIYREMELRLSEAQDFDVAEYLTRFPDFSSAINDSLELLEEKFPKDRYFSTVNTTRMFHFTDDENLDFEVENSPVVSVPQSLGTYSDITQINSGSFGIVCRAKDSRDGRIVALKFPRRDRLTKVSDMKMFLAEATKAKKLEHPGIVRTYSIENSNGYLAIVQQFVDGTDLKVAKEKLEDKKDIASLVANVADALAYAHRQGVFHRDLKPANILIDAQGRPFVVDFGLAIDDNEQIYLPRQRCGTTFYMPPEQVAGLTRLVDGRSDIWSLGVVLYELLTKQKPFRGVTDSDIFYQIENKDPRPPRQIDDSIAPELQRICLKCLERQQRHRYPTAGELADDLRHWVRQPVGARSGDSSKRPFLPNGLRSYTAEDADFFLDLLPGPRDREGLPESVRFWKLRICETDAMEAKVPVGIIFGPSGSGKSSFVKAALLANLDDDILCVYVEASAADTEARLLKVLRQKLEGVPEDITLPELFRGLGKGAWRRSRFRKVLLVIDQFEQRLSQGDDYPASQLVKALRHCDGEALQSLLLSRDDFMMALSRFFDALELDFREGENAQAIDLFDRKHARMILAKLGRAFEQLPDEPTALSAEHEEFLDEAVEQLATENQIICVHLVLFAEMFRHRPWTIADLKSVGGVEGTGEKFLEATFGPHSFDKRFRMQRESAKRVLQTLLPALGTDIRGAMKPEHELISAARMQHSPEHFRELINSLDGRLKLITRTDPDTSDNPIPDSPNRPGQTVFYQLTHDYLVPSIRSWLMREKKSTRSGRTELAFLDKSSEWIRSPGPRKLLTITELFHVFLYRHRISMTDKQQAFLGTSLKHNGWVFGVRALVLCSVFVVAILMVRQIGENRSNFIRKSIDSLLAASTEQQISGELNEIQRLGDAAEESISERMLDAELTERQRTVLRLAMLRLGNNVALQGLISRALDAELVEFQLIRNELKLPDDSLTRPLWNVALDDAESMGRRLRAVCLLAKWKPGSASWNKETLPYVQMLTSVAPADCETWLTFLKPVQDTLISDVSRFLKPFDRSSDFTDSANLARVEQQAFGCILLFHLGTPYPFYEALLNQVDPTVCTQIIHSPYNQILSTSAIRSEIQGNDLIVEGKSPLIQLLGVRGTPKSFDRDFVDKLLELSKREANASLHASVLWALQKCGLRDEATTLSEQLPASETLAPRTPFIDGLGHPMVTIPFEFDPQFASKVNQFDESSKTRRLIAICSVEESNAIVGKWPMLDHGNLDSRLPSTSLSPNQIMKYCNWLSQQAGIEPSQYCYEAAEDGRMVCKPNFLELSGYRLPLQVEWEFASAANCRWSRYFGGLEEHMPNYAWFERNAKGEIQPSSQLLPNAFGLFDTLGNCWEWCHATTPDKKQTLILCGGGASGTESVVSLDEITRHREFDPDAPMPLGGFRVVRTLKFDHQ